MYEWKVSAKYLTVHYVLAGIILVWALISSIFIVSMANNFAKEINATYKIESVALEIEYERYGYYRLDPDTTGHTVVKFYNEDMTNAIDTKEEAIKYIDLNYKIKHFLSIGMIFCAICFFAYLFLMVLCLFQRQNCIFSVLSLTGSLVGFLVSLGINPYFIFLCFGFTLISILFGIFYNYKKIKEMNYRILNRKEIYS